MRAKLHVELSHKECVILAEALHAWVDPIGYIESEAHLLKGKTGKQPTPEESKALLRKLIHYAHVRAGDRH